jgi:hypothetical protein
MEVRFNQSLSRYRVSVDPRAYRRLADGVLPNWVLADRHLADWSRLIDGLRVREVGSASGGYQGKRCNRCNQNFRHGASPVG